MVVQHSVRRYRGPFFEVLRTRLGDDGVNLRLIHSSDPDDLAPSPGKVSLPWAEVRPGRRVRVLSRPLLWQPVLTSTRPAALVVVEQAAHLLVNYPLIVRQLLGGSPVALWGHGRNFLRPGGSRSPAEAAKRVLSRRAHWWFAYNSRSAAVVEELGYPGNRITVVQNATDSRRLQREVDALSPDDLEAVRRRLGLSGRNVCCFVGSYGASKQLDHLFAAADLVRRLVPDFELVMVGRGTRAPEVAAWCRERPWATDAGAFFEDDLARLLAVAKLLLVPAWAGLVIVDGFGAGVPLVASSAFPHPPEVEYVRDGYNGVLVDDDGDPTRYGAAVADLLVDEGRRQALVAGCRASCNEYNVEVMAARFAEGVLQALRAQPLRWR